VVLLREEFDDWAVHFDPDTGHGFGLSPTGVHVWKLLDGEHTIDAIIEELRAHAENIPEDAIDDIGTFIDALVAEGLAGLDSTGWVLEKCSYAPAVEVSAVKSCTYEPPNLINLNSGQAAYGANCNSSGSQATQQCGTGNLACSCNTGTGRTYTSCCPGTCPDQPACIGCGMSGCPDSEIIFCYSGDCAVYHICYTGSGGGG
jgi:SynChlorMet cassette protein ScmD